MDLITVHEDHFCLCSTSPKKSCEDIWSIATAGKLVRHYPEVFVKDLGTLPGIVHLRVDENAEPSVTPLWQILTALREKFKAQLDHLENLGELTKVNEPTAWVSTVVIATKKSGALRICIDPRPLNQALKRDTSAANPRRLNTRAGSSEELFNHWSYRRVLALCAWRQVQSLDYLCNPLQKILVEKTPVWSISIMQDLPEMGESSPRRTGRNT